MGGKAARGTLTKPWEPSDSPWGGPSAVPSQFGYDAHSNVRRCRAVRLIKSREVLALTGLSADQLREWTVRRALVQSDVPARKRGSEAKFSWQTVLLLRLVVVLRTRFHVELQAH